eukprot:3431172-Prymnesium_polylepis.1
MSNFGSLRGTGSGTLSVVRLCRRSVAAALKSCSIILTPEEKPRAKSGSGFQASPSRVELEVFSTVGDSVEGFHPQINL